MLPRVRAGQYEVTAYSDAHLEGPPQQRFPDVPPGVWTPDLLTANGKLRLNVGCFLIKGGRKTVLVDCGIGPDPGNRFGGARGVLGQDLQREGVRMEDIDIVLFTHLHADHVGWSVRLENGAIRPAFPRATYLAPRADFETLSRPEFLANPRYAHMQEAIIPLRRLGLVELIDGGHQVAPEVRTWHTPGHTPGHMAVVIGEGKGHVVLLGDVLHHPVQVTHTEWCHSADIEPTLSRKTRAEVVERLAREQTVIAGAHLPDGFGRIGTDARGRRWAPVSE